MPPVVARAELLGTTPRHMALPPCKQRAGRPYPLVVRGCAVDPTDHSTSVAACDVRFSLESLVVSAEQAMASFRRAYTSYSYCDNVALLAGMRRQRGPFPGWPLSDSSDLSR